MKVEVNFKMKHILKRNIDSLHHLHLNDLHRCSSIGRRRRSTRQQSRQYQQQSTNNQANHLQHNVEQLLNVKRALFVDSDLIDHHQQTSELLKSEMDKIEEEQSARYNFDFKNELPLKGNFQWVKMSTESPSTPSTPPTPPQPPSSSSSSSSTTTTTTSDSISTASS